jgi:hypothetical protein
MNNFRNLIVAAIAVTAVGHVYAQVPQLPKEISGRWTMQSTGRTQTFAIEDISLEADKTFRARLTWWTSDPRCLIKNEPIVGKLSDEGIAFDAKNKCDVSFTTKLSRKEAGWAGTATTTSGPVVVLDLKAN